MSELRAHLLTLGDGDVALAVDDDDVRGLAVLDASGYRVGEVDDLVVDDEEHRARLLVVASGGILGLGARRHLVPVEAVSRVSDDHVRLHHSSVDLPEDPDPTALDAGDYASVYDSYGCTPFWEAGHARPYFHDRRW